jgi:hypothetical protein
MKGTIISRQESTQGKRMRLLETVTISGLLGTSIAMLNTPSGAHQSPVNQAELVSLCVFIGLSIFVLIRRAQHKCR